MARLQQTDEAPITAKEFQEWRLKCGWTQQRAARWLRVNPRTYQNWEQDHREAQQPGPLRIRMMQATARKRPDPAQMTFEDAE